MFSAADIKQRMAERDAAKAAELVSHHLGRSTEADHPLKRGYLHVTRGASSRVLRAAGPALLFGLRLRASALFLGYLFDQLAALLKDSRGRLTGVGL